MDRQGSVVVGTSVWIFWPFLVCFDTFVHCASRLNHMVQSLFHFQVFFLLFSCFHFIGMWRFLPIFDEYSRLLVTRTLFNSNFPLTRSNFHFPSDHFLYNSTLDNSNCFLFPWRFELSGVDCSLLQKCWFYGLSLLWKTCFTYCPYDVMPNVLTQTCFMTSYITCLPKLVLWW